MTPIRFFDTTWQPHARSGISDVCNIFIRIHDYEEMQRKLKLVEPW